ncbi:MAG: GNAT family N-acetyltransferase [Alphaproteobacteria bacterium]|nr:GNAT family N-acetyltransferase [Alphaproteobacteria bacterium]MBL6937032.1 GNAT family N-acetyltransferase [Alphaproteobacteria bacterium]MBL7097801.1 GNAT family N-acetyltransferase [Alphaproteobacteria bacterium]
MSDIFIYTSPEDERARPLIDALTFEYDSRYAHDYPEATLEMSSFPADLFLPPHGAFILLLRQGVAIAGGAFKRFDGTTAEFKRIWTHAELRRQGLGRKVLDELEVHARRTGYERVFLTSGFRQPEAHALYFSAGYTPLFDQTLDPQVYGILPFVKALRPLSTPLDTGLRYAQRLDLRPARHPAS